MASGKGSAQVTVVIPAGDVEIYRQIAARADSLGWTRSQYSLAVLEWWRGQNYPAVSAQDQAMIVSKQMAATKRKS